MRFLASIAIIASFHGVSTLAGSLKFRFWRNIALNAAIASAIASLSPLPCPALIAPLADVGVREFLVKDGRKFLRLNMPSGKAMKLGASSQGEPDRLAQEAVELIGLRFEQVGVTNPSIWGACQTDIKTATSIIESNKRILSATAEAATILDEDVLPALTQLQAAIRAKDIYETVKWQEATASGLARVRLGLLPKRQLPFTIPEEYSSLPRLAGRATIAIAVDSKSGGFRLKDGKTVVPSTSFEVELDGYHAPLTAGNFLDLVNNKFYDNLKFQSIQELTLQTGKRPAEGPRKVPLELFYKQDAEPVYGITSDDDMRATETMALPFQAYGALGMARENDDPDSASTQFFLLKWRQALIAPGRNTLDGFYSCFGYVVSDNEYLLGQVTDKDVISSARVLSGLDNLIRP